MVSTETYSIEVDFSENPYEYQLQMEIIANTTITTAINYITRVDDNINVIFVSKLSSPEKTELDIIIGNHVPSNIDSYTIITSITPSIGNIAKKDEKTHNRHTTRQRIQNLLSN